MEGEYDANLNGLALIGKLGVKEACRLSSEALEEAMGEFSASDTRGPVLEMIYASLGTSKEDLEFLVVLEFSDKNLNEIHNELEAGALVPPSQTL